MLLRKLLFLMVALGLGWLVQRLVNASARAVSRNQRRQVPQQPGRPTAMVRDRVCNTFLPESSALATTVDGQTHHFCSERCRRQFLDSARTAPTTVS